jgi:starch phosphorylase
VRSATCRPDWAATPRDWLGAVAALARERLTEQWFGPAPPARSDNVRRICYLSLEFLPGRVITDALQKLGLYDTCRAALADHGADIEEITELEVDPALGNGGLGRLASCLLDSMANLGLRAYGYGIRYDCGLFSQHFENGWQVERPERWLDFGDPWEIPRRELLYPVAFGGRVQGEWDTDGPRRHWVETDEVMATAFDMPLPGYQSRRLNTLRLWSPRVAHELDLHAFNDGRHDDAFARRNAMQSLSQVLYPSEATAAGRELRFRQEYFFVSASIQDILRRFQRLGRPLDRFHEELVIHINDTHPSLAIAELMRQLVDTYRLDWGTAWHVTRNSFAYTNHTLMPEALETWPVQLFEKLLPRHLEIVWEINSRFLKSVARRRPHDDGLLRRVSLIDETGERRVRMAHLAVVGSRRVNGVSKMHSDLLKRTLFADFDALDPDKFVNVTNGITFRRWLHGTNPELTALIRSRLGDRWLGRAEDLAALAPHAEDPAFRAAFRAIKRDSKRRLAALIQRDCGVAVEIDSLFDVQIKRIHEYKRQLLNILHVVALYDRMRRGEAAPTLPRTVIFAGKAAPGYAIAKLIVKLIHDVAETVNSDPIVNGRLKIVFVPDYNVTKAQKIIPAADLSQQISTAGHEASGTGNMKLALNGALTIGTLDGANIEIRDAVGAENFFRFGATVEEVPGLRATAEAGVLVPADPIARVLDLVASGHFLPARPDLFRPIVDGLLHGDHYLVLADFADYLRSQSAVEALYRDPEEWSRRAILNIAGASRFSSDGAVRHYCDLIWRRGIDDDELEADAEAVFLHPAAAE